MFGQWKKGNIFRYLEKWKKFKYLGNRKKEIFSVFWERGKGKYFQIFGKWNKENILRYLANRKKRKKSDIWELEKANIWATVDVLWSGPSSLTSNTPMSH